jgi:type I restriction enzyme R subunit
MKVGLRKFANVPFEDKSGSWQLRYYQEIAVQRTVEAIAKAKKEFCSPLPQAQAKRLLLFK